VLVAHFAAEEVEEFFGSLVTEEPRLLERVERLHVEHGEMAETLDQLVEFANATPAPRELAAHIAQFLDRFEAHEHAENALMREFIRLAADVRC
jgi:hypothetical protein